MITVAVERDEHGNHTWTLSSEFDSAEALWESVTTGGIHNIQVALHKRYPHTPGPDCTGECILFESAP